MSVDHIVYVGPEDDLASLREQLTRIKEPTVIIVVANNATVWRSAVNMQALRRYAEQMAVRIVVVARNGATRDAAQRAGLPVYSSLQGVPRKSRGGLTKEELAASPRLPPAPFYRYLFKLVLAPIGLAIFALGVAVAVGVAVFVAPSATITITPAYESMGLTLDLLASPQIRVIDVASGQFPARPVQVLIEDTGQVETTGRKRVPDAPATGTVVFVNRSQNALTVPKGTGVRTATGVSIRFRTEEDATLLAGASSTARVPIKAIEPGPTGNVKAGAISVVEGMLSFQVSVLNDEDTKGGTEKQARYVTLQDRNNLRDAIVQKIRAKSYTELRQAIRPDDVVPAETLTLTVNETAFDKPLDAEGEYLTGKVRATVSGLLLDGDSLKEMAAVGLRDQVSGGFVVLPQGVTYGAPANVKYSDGVVSLQMSATARSQATISVQDVRRLAASKSVAGAKEALAASLPLARPPQIELRNALLERLPWLSARNGLLDRLPWVKARSDWLERLPWLTARIEVIVVNE